jgi:hypothetical protein
MVMTGLSGSGKSSLAFDTIYAEGQRRYVESLSAYARQFLEMMQKPDVDQIDGLSPAISIEQKTTSKNPRSTVGTVTEIYDYMRLLFARVGMPYSPATGLPIESQTVSQMVDRVMALPEGTRLYLLAPIVRGRKGEYKQGTRRLQKRASSASRSTARSTRSPTPRRSTRSSSTTSTWWSTASSCAPGWKPALADSLRDRAEAGRRHRRRRIRRPLMPRKERRSARAHLLGEIRLPGLRLHHSRDRAAAVLLQQPVRRLPGLRRPRHEQRSTRPGRAGRADAARRRHRALGQVDLALLHQTLEALAKHYGFSLEDRLEDLPRGAQT